MIDVLLSLIFLFQSIGQDIVALQKRLIKEIPERKKYILQYINPEYLKIDEEEIKRLRRKKRRYNRQTLEDYLKLPAFSREGLSKGLEFVRRNKDILNYVENEFKISKYDIAAIIGIESYWGAYVGKYNLMKQLVENYLIKRNEFWYDAIRSTILLKLDPNLRCSFSGAIGIAQFMPNSFLKYGKDGNNDGKIDPFSYEDCIVSIANYLYMHNYSKNREKAIFHYNPSKSYVKAVIRLSNMLRLEEQKQKRGDKK